MRLSYFIVSILISFFCAFTSQTHATPQTLLETVPQSGFSLANAITASTLNDFGQLIKNPATITNLRNTEFKTSYSSFYDSEFTGFEAGAATPLSDNVFVGILLPIQTIQDIPETINASGQARQVGSYSDMEGQMILSLGVKLSERLKVGVNYNYYFHTIENESAKQSSIDIGILARIKDFNIGFSVQQLNPSITWTTGLEESFGLKINAGISQRFLDEKLTVLMDFGNKNKLQLGGQYQLSPNFSLQGGIQEIGDMNSLRLGTLLSFGAHKLHYSFSNSKNLGNSHKLGFTFNING